MGPDYKGNFRNRNLFKSKNTKFWWVPEFFDTHSGHIKYWLKHVYCDILYPPYIQYLWVHMFFKASEEDDDREYEVEKLLDRRVTSSKADEEGNKIKTTKYLVKWVGYPSYVDF